MGLCQCNQFGRGIKGGDAMALCVENLGIPARAATGVENVCPGRQMGKKAVMQRCHVDSLRLRKEFLGIAVVISDGVIL